MDAERIHFSSENAEPAKLEYTTIYPDTWVCMVHYQDTKVTIDFVDVSICLVFHSLILIYFWSTLAGDSHLHSLYPQKKTAFDGRLPTNRSWGA